MISADGQEVQAEPLGQTAAHQDPAHAVAAPVQQRRAHPMPSWPGSTATMPPPPAFGRHTDRADPVAGGVGIPQVTITLSVRCTTGCWSPASRSAG